MTLKDVRNSVKVFTFTIIGIVLALGSIISLYKDFFRVTENETLLAVGIVSFFSLYFFVLHVFTRAKWEKRSRYPDLFNELNKGFREIHALHRESDVNKQLVVSKFKELCRCLSSGFSYISGTKCSACIKILTTTKGQDNLIYETLCRNPDVDAMRIKADTSANKDGIEHSLEENTAFQEAVHANEECFISNRLPLWDGYKNTSFQFYGEPYRGFNIFYRWLYWPLPYQSTIVVPIKPLISLDSKGEEITDDKYGFLCIDSNKMGAFNHDYDTKIMKGVADGIYNTFSKFKNV